MQDFHKCITGSYLFDCLDKFLILFVKLQGTCTDTQIHPCMHTCTHNRKLPPGSNEFMQITKMQILLVRLSCPMMHFEKNTTKWEGGTHNKSILFNLDRQKDNLIPTLTAFPPQYPAFPHSATPSCIPCPLGLKPQV